MQGENYNPKQLSRGRVRDMINLAYRFRTYTRSMLQIKNFLKNTRNIRYRTYLLSLIHPLKKSPKDTVMLSVYKQKNTKRKTRLFFKRNTLRKFLWGQPSLKNPLHSQFKIKIYRNLNFISYCSSTSMRNFKE